ncbi:MAG: hypothetical protein SFT81_04755 [Candidatus Caenarcaniphilales bacterium]|nr:hypothetical protein [Candidatus Caenarcaniphilales bacterium]
MKKFSLIAIILLILSSSTKAKVYDADTAVGKYQQMGTLAPINPHSSPEAEEALILIPGLNSMDLDSELYEWKSFWYRWNSYPMTDQERAKYKLFVFHYHGWNSLYDSSCLLEQGLRELVTNEPNIKRVSFIGYSQGGLISRILLSEHPDLEKITRRVQTLAAPHQGAYILSEKLLTDSAKHESNPLEAGKYLSMMPFFRDRYVYAFREQAYTNFDQGIPPSADYDVPEEALKLPIPPNPEKFITYASYVKAAFPLNFESSFGIIFGDKIPELFLNRKAGLRGLNRWMSTVTYIDEKPAFRDHMRLNDGVTPLASGIWARVCMSGEEQPSNWKQLFPTNNFCPVTKKQRVFYGIDHLRWRKPSSGVMKVKDEFEPQLPSSHPYDWIIADLLE